MTLSCTPARTRTSNAGPPFPQTASEPRSASDGASDGEQEAPPSDDGPQAQVQRADDTQTIEHFDRPDHWPPVLPTPEAVPLTNSTSTTGEAGDVLLRHWVPQDRADVAFGNWIDALDGAGAITAEGCKDLPAKACTFQVSDRRGHMWIGEPYPGSESMLITLQLGPPNHTPLRTLPGSCVTPSAPERELTVHAGGIDQEGEYRSASTLWRIAAFDGPDLDGDGVSDRFVPARSTESCPWSIPYDVYIMRGSCGHKVGTIVGHIDEPTYIAPMKKGIREVHTRAEWAEYGRTRPEPIHHTVLRTYAFDGHKLVLRDTDKREGVCHHCGVASCR